jgi:prepilin-type N-terminal cleavage/methylation domain-containing protein
MRKHNLHSAGFTLVELMIVVAIVGIMAMTATPLLMDYIAEAKTVEAKLNLKAIGDGSVAFFNSETPTKDGKNVLFGQYPSAQNASLMALGKSTWTKDAIGSMPYKRGELYKYGINGGLGIKANPNDSYNKPLFDMLPWVAIRFRLTSPFIYSYNYQGGGGNATITTNKDGSKKFNNMNEKGNAVYFASTACACLKKQCAYYQTDNDGNYVKGKDGKNVDIGKTQCDSSFLIIGGPSGRLTGIIDNSDFSIEKDCCKALLSDILGGGKGGKVPPSAFNL